MNTFGNIYRLTSFGESHGPAIGGVIDGMPAGIEVDMDFIQQQLDRRRPGQSALTTARKETDQLEILSGVFKGRTTGTPIGFIVRNHDAQSKDYDNLKDIYRPSHADYTYEAKYGIRDHRGGGRSSARETISRVVAGAFAMLILRQKGITIESYISQVGHIRGAQGDEAAQKEMYELIHQVQTEGDTIGGTVTCRIKGCPVGLGEPVFGKLHAALGAAMLSINACHGFDYGAGFEGINQRGSEQNDSYTADGQLRSNNSGGIQGGISNGQEIYFRCLFKPVATLLQEQTTLNRQGEVVTTKAHGRHDPCVLLRALPIVEAMAAITLLDFILIGQR